MMDLELTPWTPFGETVQHPTQRRLMAALRATLPKREVSDQPEWLHGEINDMQYPLSNAKQANASNAVLLTKLSWRLVEFLACNQRDMGQWRYQGIAWIDDKRIDFSGTYLRDLTTGGFWEFELKTMGS